MLRRIYAMLMLVFVITLQTSSLYSRENLNKFSGYSCQVRNWLPGSNTPASIYSIAQTPDGYLWLANEFGLYRFDGLHFTLFNQSSKGPFKYQDCSALYLTRDSTLIAGFSKGLLLAYKNQQWSLLDSEKVFMYKDITAISEDIDHNLWIGLSGRGVIRYTRKTSAVINISEGICDNNINVICPGKGHDIWIGTDNGLCLIENNKIIRFSELDGLKHQNVNALWMDPENTLWIGTADGHLLYLENGKIFSFEDKPGMIKSCIRQIIGYEKNMLAIATEGQGLLFLNTKSGKAEPPVTGKNNLSNLVLT